MKNCEEDLDLVRLFNVNHGKVQNRSSIECESILREHNKLMLSCNEAAKPNTCLARAGCILCDAQRLFLDALAVGLVATTIYEVEIEVIVTRLE